MKLPVLHTARESYLYVRRNLALLALPTLLLCIADLLTGYLSSQDASRSMFWQGMAPIWPIVASLVDIAFVVGLHRAIILGEVRTGPAFFRWDRYMVRYAMATILFSFMLIGLALVLVWISHGFLADLQSLPAWQFAALALLAIPVAYLMIRVTLAFAAAAVGERNVFRFSWRATSGNTLRLFGVLTLTMIPPLVVGLIVFTPIFVAAGLENVATTANSPAFLVVDAIIGAAVTVLMTVAVSFSYQILAPSQSAEPGPEVL